MRNLDLLTKYLNFGSICSYEVAYNNLIFPDGNTRMNFTILEKSEENAFDVNTTSGAVFSILPIDYEKISSHWMIVLVQDFTKSEPQSTNINVTVSTNVCMIIYHFFSYKAV